MQTQKSELDIIASYMRTNPDAQRQLRTALYLKDINAFIEDAWKVIEPATPYSHNWHIDYLIEEVLSRFRNEVEHVYPDADWDSLDEQRRRLIVNVPTRSMKTLLISVFIPLWLLLHNPSLKFATVSYAEDIAIDINVKRLQILESEWWAEHFSHIATVSDDRANQKMIMLEQRGELYTASIGGRFTGKGADIIIIDDAQKPADMGSHTESMKAINFITETMPTRINNMNGVVINIQQRLGSGDLTGFLLENQASIWDIVKIPLEFKESSTFIGKLSKKEWKVKSGDLLWEERMPKKWVEMLKVSLGARIFSAQQLQEPVPDKGTYVDGEWFSDARYDGTPQQWIEWQKKYQPETFAKMRLVISVDANYAGDKAKSSEEQDPVGIVVLAYDSETERAYLLEAREHSWSFNQSLSGIYRYRDRYLNHGFQDVVVLIEKKANGGPIIAILQQNIAGIIPYDPEISNKIARLNSVTPRMESKNLRLPNDNFGGDWLQVFMKQLLEFPNVQHDDMVDALSQAMIYLFVNNRRSSVEYGVIF